MPRERNHSRDYGGFLLTFEPGRAQWLADRLYPGMQHLSLSESFSSRDWEMERRELVCLMFHANPPRSIGALALLERMHGTGGFATLKMRFANMVVFDEPIPLSQLNLNDLDSKVSTPSSIKRLDATTWSQLLGHIKTARPNDASNIDALVSTREAERRLLGDSGRVARLNEQRDGLGLALDIGGLDRASALKSIRVEQVDQADSIVDLLDEVVPVYERSMIEHDGALFQSLLQVEPGDSAIFSNGHDRSVRIWVTDRTDLEQVLGIDLIVYSTQYNNFLLLQYKRMRKDGDGWSYSISPSSNLKNQLAQMMEFQSLVEQSIVRASAIPPSLWSYRLNEDPCYFKFCEHFRPNASDASLVPGITLSATHLNTFLTLPQARGIQGGTKVGYQNCPRYLNNTEFIQLARAGWIGGGQAYTNMMRDLLHANMEGGRTAMLAIIDTVQATSAAARHWNR